jgi:hypothetical protein
MMPTPTTGFRLPAELLARVDEYKERLAQIAGVPVSRAAAVAKLLAIALEVESVTPAPSKRPKRKS